MLLASIDAPFIPGWLELRPFLTELWLVGTIVAVLLTPFFVRRPNAAAAMVALFGLGLALVSLVAVGAGAGEAAERFRPMLVSDGVSFLWKVLLLLFVMGVILMWFASTSATMHEGDGPEFFTLLLGATLGMSLMASASNLLMLFMAVETASLPSYVLAGFRKTNRIGAEASLKYVLFGAATSAIMAYGISILYGLYGTLQLYSTDSAAGHVAGLAERMVTSGSSSAILVVALLGIIAGLGFKISAVPFHFWCPDVFEGASIDVTTFLSVASKGAGLVLLLRVVMAIAGARNYAFAGATASTAVVIGVMGAITCTVGNTAAYVQTNIKRLLAYSSIAHAGYMLCAISLLVRHGAQLAEPANQAASAILLYLAVYMFMNLGAFTVAALVAREAGNETLDGYRGLGRRAPLLAACMFAFMISLIGLPPFAGFVAKLNLLWVLFENGGWWWALIIAIGVNTIISAFYYFRVIRAMYLESGDAPAFTGHPLGLALGVVCAAVLFFLFVGFNPLSNITTAYGKLRPVGASAMTSPATTQPSAAASLAAPPATAARAARVASVR